MILRMVLQLGVVAKTAAVVLQRDVNKSRLYNVYDEFP